MLAGSRLARLALNVARSRIRLTTRLAGGAMTDQLSRRDFLGRRGRDGCGRARALRARRARKDRPNVLFILADDLGYGDLSSYGRPDYDTPVLDRLATQGMKFTSAYAAAPVCTPTRCRVHDGAVIRSGSRSDCRSR